MEWIVQLEDAVVAQCRALLGQHVREVTTAGGTWTTDMLRRALANAPGVYVAWLGGRMQNTHQFRNSLDVYVVTSHGGGEERRRRGDAQVVGSHQINALLMAGLNDHVVNGVGTLRLVQVRNLFQEALFDLGGTVYGLNFEIDTDATLEADPAQLNDFLLFEADYDVDPEHQDGPVASDSVEMPQ